MTNITEPITIDNQDFFSVKQFGLITAHSEASIRGLIRDGNKFRKLKCKRLNY